PAPDIPIGEPKVKLLPEHKVKINLRIKNSYVLYKKLKCVYNINTCYRALYLNNDDENKSIKWLNSYGNVYNKCKVAPLIKYLPLQSINQLQQLIPKQQSSQTVFPNHSNNNVQLLLNNNEF